MGTVPTTGRARSRRAALRLAAAVAGGTAAGGLARTARATAACGAGPEDVVAEAGDECALGVFPYLPPLSLDRVFAPIVGDLCRALGRTVRLRTKPTFEAFAEALSARAYDLALVHPFLYVAAAAQGYRPLVRVDEPLRVVFLTRNGGTDDGGGGGVRGFGDLAGQTLVLPPALSAASEMVMAALAEAGLRPGTAGADVRLRHLASKLSCVQAVTLGEAASCALPSFAVGQLEAETGGRLPLRVLHETSLPVGLAVVAHGGRLPEAARALVRDLMVGWSGTVEGRAILAGTGWPGFVPALDGDYDVARAMLARRLRPAGPAAPPRLR